MNVCKKTATLVKDFSKKASSGKEKADDLNNHVKERK